MSLFKRLTRYLVEKILGTNDNQDSSVKMERIEHPQVILIDSDNEEEPSWRGIRHEGTQSSDEIQETVRSSDDEESENEGLEAAEDIHPSLNASTIKKEHSEDSDEIDDYVYEKISFVDFSDEEEDNLSLPSPQVPLQEVKEEILSSTDASNSGINKEVVHSPEICREETSSRFEADLSMPRVPVTTIKLEECEMKRESLENVWNMPRVKEEMDLDPTRSFSQEMSLFPENTGLSQSFQSLNTSEPLQDLENFTYTQTNRISIDNSSDESEISGENDLEAFLDIDDLIHEIEETENLEEIVSMLDSTTFFNKNNEFSEGENTLFDTRKDERREKKNSRDKMENTGERNISLAADDPFMDISTQSQVLDFDEEYTDDESDDESISIHLESSDQQSEDVESDEEPEEMEISSRNNSFGDQMATIKNSDEYIPSISGDISGDDDEVVEDDETESLEGNNCTRENSTENMEISTGEVSEEIDKNGKNHETINNGISSATESGNIGETGDNSEETVGDKESVDESRDNDDVLSLSTTMSDGSPDDDLEFGETSDEDLDEAVPIAESTGINITEWILQGMKRRLEGSDDDVSGQPAAKVQRLEETLENDYFFSKIDPVESIDLAAKGVSPRSSATASIPLRTESGSNFQEGKSLNDDEDDSASEMETTSWSRKLKNSGRKYNVSDTSSDSDKSTSQTLKTPEVSPKMGVDQEEVNPEKSKKKFRESLFVKKSKSPVISSPATVNSPESDKTSLNSLKKTFKRSVKPSNPKKIQKKDFDDFQKKRKSSSRLSDSSKEENSPKIVAKSTNLKKKRKLYSQSDSIEDLIDFRKDAVEPSSNKSPGTSGKSPKSSDRFQETQSTVELPKMMKKSRIIPVEYYKTLKTVVPTSRINNPVTQSSSKDVMYSEFDFLTQKMNSPLNSQKETSPSDLNTSSETPETPVTSKNVSTDSQKMKESSEESPEVENSNSVGEKSSKPSGVPENNSPGETVEFIDLGAEDLDILTEKTSKALEDEDDPMELPPTQVSHWTPSTSLQKSSKSPEKVVSINSSPILSQKLCENELKTSPAPSEVTQNHFVSLQTAIECLATELKVQESSRVDSGPPGEEKPMEISLTLPKTLIFPSSKTSIHPKVFQDDETSEIFVRETIKETINERPSTSLLIELSDDEEMLDASSPAVTPENETTPLIKSSVSEISSPSELTEDQVPGELDSELEILQIMKPFPSTPIPVYSLTDDEEETEIPSEVPANPLQISNSSEVRVSLPQVSNPPTEVPTVPLQVSHPPQVPINPLQVSNPSQVPEKSPTEVPTVPLQISNPLQVPTNPPKVSNTSQVSGNLPPKVPIVSLQVLDLPKLPINFAHVINPSKVPASLPQVSNTPQQNEPTDEESQLTHISQLRKSLTVPSKQPEPQPSTSRDRSISPTDMERLIVYPTDDPKGWNTEDDNETEDEVPEKEPKDDSSKSQRLTSKSIDSEGSDDDSDDDEDESSSNSSKSSSEIQSKPQSEDSDYQSLEDGRLSHSIPTKPSKPKEKKLEIKKDKKSKTKPKKKKPNYLHHRLPKSRDNQPADEKTQEEAEKTIKAISEIHKQLQNKPPSDVRMKTPKNMQIKLLDHQKYALPWMLWREECKPAGGILADDMGLGKTITTIALIMKSLQRERKQKKKNHRGGTLIVCPAHLISQWQQEIESKGEIARVRSYHKEKEKSMSVLRNLSVVITSYETLANDFKSKEKILFKIHWTRVVLDEAHYIRNSGSLKSEVVYELKTDKRWALTGTPIHNEVKDIFAILRFLRLEPFHNLKHFNKWMGNHDEAGTARLHCVIKCVMLRRSKKGLVAEGMMPQLPMKTDRIIQISLNKWERLVYERVMILSRTLFVQFLHQKMEKERERVAGGDYLWSRDLSKVKLSKRQVEFLMRRGTVTRYHLLTLILRLRQCCDHPSLIQDTLDEKDFETAGVEKPNYKDLREANRSVLEDLSALEEDEDDGVIEVDERIIQGNISREENSVFDVTKASSKMMQMLEEVKRILRKNEKIVIVSDWVKYLEMIGRHLNEIAEIADKFGFYTGKISSEQRKRNVHAFNKGRKMMILLLSLKAGGQGLNLMAANHVMLMDVHWNPQLEVQAEDRVYRIGQTKNVIIHRFIVVDTIEERIVQLQKRKKMMAEAVLSGSGQDEINILQLEEMRSLFNL